MSRTAEDHHTARTALVTGGNRGIGLAIGRGLAGAGLTVLLGSRDAVAGAEAAQSLEGDVRAVPLDLSDRGALLDQAGNLLAEYGPVDVLVNNAGIMPRSGLLDIDETDFDAALRIHVSGPLDLIRMVAPDMIARDWGRIVNVSSGWGAFAEGLEGPGGYAVSKAALNALTVSLARELPASVKINSMCPGWVRTRMGGPDAPRSPEEGADTAVWLATLPDDGPTGGFWRRRRRVDW